MSDTPETDIKLAEGGAAHLNVVPASFARFLERRLQEAQAELESARTALFSEGARSGAAKAERDAALREVEEMRKWLDSNTVHCPPKQVPILSSVSKRIWYHATDDMENYPFTAVIDAALAEKGKP